MHLFDKYPPMLPPFEVVDFSDMTKKQAQEHFDWFVNEIPNRLKVLREAIEESGVNDFEHNDMSPESLSILWDWFKVRIKTVSKTNEEMINLKKNLPNWVIENVSDWKLDPESMTIAVDISLYFAEVFLRKYSQLQWGYKNKPKLDAYLNKPVVLGFKCGPLHPPTVVHNLSRSYVEGKKDKDLLSLFEVWSKFI